MKVHHIGALLAAAAAATTIAAAPAALADVIVVQHPGNAEITTTPGAAVKHAAELQEPFGDGPFLVFHH
ncbi:hypothetical protein [Mycobacterium sp. AT1]|uniref:hypothetical protein n=1 Tax=Mycobacterium sp. AT1 TaxID=1961706 RepID=UPI0009AD349E|nr:hypothetical protein [Mycobacterium sp. AT1]OPX08425.1 hypothetical protein B1790_19385 [Mycobacterium sp. AT1]